MRPVKGIIVLVLLSFSLLFLKNLVYPVTNTSISLKSNPRSIAINPITDIAVITHEKSNSVSVVDLNTEKVISTIPVGREPKGVAIDSGLNIALVTNSHGDTVSVIDLSIL